MPHVVNCWLDGRKPMADIACGRPVLFYSGADAAHISTNRTSWITQAGDDVRLILVLFLVLSSANLLAADSFERRVEIAKKFEDTDQGQAYEKLLLEATGDYISIAMQQCFPKDVKADTGRFVVVADLQANRSLSGVDFRPRTKMARCFVDKFSKAPFPGPPSYAGPGGLPIVFDMKIVN